MEKIFDKLPLDQETKDSLNEAFKKEVLLEATSLSVSKEEEYEAYMKTSLDEAKTELTNTVDAYLEKVVEEFVEDNTFSIDESIKKEKYNAVLEGFESLMITSGVTLAEISEAKDNQEEVIDESGSKRTLDDLMNENIEVKNKLNKALKLGLVQEISEGMTMIEKNKFVKLAQVIDFDNTDPEDFVNKIDTIAESVKNTSEDDNEDDINEKINKEDSNIYVPRASHLF